MGGYGSIGLLSVVVPTVNSARTLARCLESVRAQEGSGVELIVVDDVRTSDATRSIALSYGARLIVSSAGMAESRNEGFRAARGSHFLSVDSDMVLPPDLQLALTRHFSNVDALSICERAVGDGYWARARAMDKVAAEELGLARSIRAFSREVFFAVGGYDPNLEAGEDLDMHLRICASGAIVGHIHQPWIEHDEGRLTLGAAVAKKYRYGRTVGMFSAKHGLHPLIDGAARRVGQGIMMGLRSDPAAAPGFAVLKSAEWLAGLLGRFLPGTTLRLRERRSASSPSHSHSESTEGIEE
jgi:glycosyltransferase involved in cell wall biosynthesis